MLKKLYKYDFLSVFRYWWIAAISSFALSIIAGICLSWLTHDRDLPIFFTSSIYRIFGLALLGLVVVAILSFVLVNVRFYKNLFTDEGYLTFTLPVKRSDLLNSKLLLGVTFSVLTTWLLTADILIMLSLPYPDTVARFFESLWELFYYPTLTDALYSIAYILEFILIGLLSLLLSTQFLYACITVTSLITKKARVLITIGIYYSVGSVTTFVTQMFFTFGIPSITRWLVAVPTNLHNITVVLIMLSIIAFLVIASTLLYVFEYWLLDRKLNLS